MLENLDILLYTTLVSQELGSVLFYPDFTE